MVFTQPLSLDYWFINTLSGSTIIFTFISVIVIAVTAAYFRMTNTVMMLMMMLFFLMMSPFIGLWSVVPIIVIGTVLSFHALSKLWE